MWVMTLNVKSNPIMSEDHVREDMKRATELAEVILWQEIEPDNYKATLKGIDKRFKHACLNTETPISWRDDLWELVHEESHKISDGRDHVSPDRHVSIVVLRHRASGVTVVFVNTHFVSGAYSNPGQLGDKDGWRLAAWADDRAGMVKHAQPWIDQGYPVVFGGDFNRKGMPKTWVNRQVWLSTTTGYDYLFFVSKGWTVELRSKSTLATDWHTDHPAKRAELFFTRVKQPPPPPPPPPPVDPVVKYPASWKTPIADWAPQSNRPGALTAYEAVSQARGYAEDAYRNAKEVSDKLADLAPAVAALAEKVAKL